MTDRPKVFISYSHDSKEHLERVLNLSNRLRAEGVDCYIDQYEESPPDGWPSWCAKQISQSTFVLLACTQTYLRRFNNEEKPGKGLGGTWEGHIIAQDLYNAQGNNQKYIPIAFCTEDCEFIPVQLQSSTHYALTDGYEQLYRRLTNQPTIVLPELGPVKTMPRRLGPPLPGLIPRQNFFEELERFSLSKTLETGGQELYEDLISNNFISHSVRGPYTLSEMVGQTARFSNKPVPIEWIAPSLNERIHPRGRSLFGCPGDYFEEAASSEDNLLWWISQKGLNISTGDPVADKSAVPPSLRVPSNLSRLSELGGLDLSGYRLYQSLKLNSYSNGIDGSILILIDERIEGLTGAIANDGYTGIQTLNIEYKPNSLPLAQDEVKQALLIVIDDHLRILYTEQLGRESARLDRVFLHKDRSNPTFILTRDYSIGFGSYNGPVSYFLEVSAKNRISYIFPHGLMTSLKTAWAIVNDGKNSEVLSKKCRPDFETATESTLGFQVIYERIHFNGISWKSSIFSEPGFWEYEKALDPDEFKLRFSKDE